MLPRDHKGLEVKDIIGTKEKFAALADLYYTTVSPEPSDKRRPKERQVVDPVDCVAALDRCSPPRAKKSRGRPGLTRRCRAGRNGRSTSFAPSS